MQKVVYVGLSGGVDSAVSAALLKREGYRVVGVFIKIWQPTFFECTWEKDRLDAMRVAVALNIPFKEIDLSAEYERDVVHEMMRSYTSGITPNPDVTCNEKIKFGSFYNWAMSDGADMVATGHYARIGELSGQPVLMRGLDRDKDQSYFLYRIPRECLRNIIFPIGSLRKTEVRSLAEEFQLPVARKHDSQGLCFVGDVSMRDFLRRYIPVEEGEVLDMNGEVIGTHEGAALYTVGQRHGFTTKGGEPQFIIRIDAKANTLTVTTDRALCAASGATLIDEHWLVDPEFPMSASAQSRYRESAITVDISRDNHCVIAKFNEPHIVSPGQSLVVYQGDVCIGGAKIASAVHSDA